MPRSNAVGGCRVSKRRGNRAETSGLAARDDKHGCLAADDRRAGKKCIEYFRGRGRIASTGIFVDRIRLSRQQRFIGVRVAAFQHDPICGDEVTGPQLDHVAGHELLDRNGGDDTVSADVRTHRNRALQRFGSAFRPVLLEYVERDREHDDGENDRETAEIPGRARYRRRHQQDCD